MNVFSGLIRATVVWIAVAVSLLPTIGIAKGDDASGAENEIRIGNIMPYSGPLSTFSVIGRTEAAYFDFVNERGGIKGRKIKFISRDDGSAAKEALAQTRSMVDVDKVRLLFGSFGTPGNLAARPFLNDNKIPQIFLASGDQEWDAPGAYPWTMGWQPPFRTEGRIYANYIQAAYPGRKIAVLWQNDQFGRDLFRGMQEGLGDSARMIVSDTTFDLSDPSLDRQIDLLRASAAEIFIFAGSPAAAVLAIRRMVETDWHPVTILNNVSSSVVHALRPAGLQNSQAVITTSFLKSATDPAWKEDAGIAEFKSFMDRYYPDGDKADSNTLFGYAAAQTLVHVLEQCGDELSRENIMRHAASLHDFRSSVTLPGISMNTSPKDFQPIKQMRLVQFDGAEWQPIGDVIDNAFLDASRK